MNRYLFKGTAVGALGGLLFGFDTPVIAGATHQLTRVYVLVPWQLGLTVAIALIGTVIGAMSAGAIGQKFGGRDTLRAMAVLYIISALGYSFPLLAKSSGAYPFVFFASKMVLQFVVVLFAYPETKGLSLGQLQRQLGIE